MSIQKILPIFIPYVRYDDRTAKRRKCKTNPLTTGLASLV